MTDVTNRSAISRKENYSKTRESGLILRRISVRRVTVISKRGGIKDNMIFYEIRKVAKPEKEPDFPDELFEEYAELGVYPDQVGEHVGFTRTREEAKEWRQTLEEGRTKDGWTALILPRNLPEDVVEIKHKS